MCTFPILVCIPFGFLLPGGIEIIIPDYLKIHDPNGQTPFCSFLHRALCDGMSNGP